MTTVASKSLARATGQEKDVKDVVTGKTKQKTLSLVTDDSFIYGGNTKKSTN